MNEVGPRSNGPLIEARGLNKNFGPIPALAGVDLELAGGQVIGLLVLRGRWHGGSLVECRRILEIAGTAACPFQPGRPGVGRDDEQSFRPGGGDIGQPVLGEPVLLLQLLPVGVDAPFGVVGELGDRIRVSPERRGQQTRIRAPVSRPVLFFKV